MGRFWYFIYTCFFWYTYIYIRLNMCFCLFLPLSPVTWNKLETKYCNRTTVSEDCDAPLIFFMFWSPMCSKTTFRRGIFGRNVTVFWQDPTSVDTQKKPRFWNFDPGSFWSFLIQVTWSLASPCHVFLGVTRPCLVRPTFISFGPQVHHLIALKEDAESRMRRGEPDAQLGSTRIPGCKRPSPRMTP